MAKEHLTGQLVIFLNFLIVKSAIKKDTQAYYNFSTVY